MNNKSNNKDIGLDKMGITIVEDLLSEELLINLIDTKNTKSIKSMKKMINRRKMIKLIRNTKLKIQSNPKR